MIAAGVLVTGVTVNALVGEHDIGEHDCDGLEPDAVRDRGYEDDHVRPEPGRHLQRDLAEL